MELYVAVSFWLSVAAFLIVVVGMLCGRFPRKCTTTLQEAVGVQCVRLAFIVWAGLLLWG